MEGFQELIYNKDSNSLKKEFGIDPLKLFLKSLGYGCTMRLLKEEKEKYTYACLLLRLQSLILRGKILETCGRNYFVECTARKKKPNQCSHSSLKIAAS